MRSLLAALVLLSALAHPATAEIAGRGRALDGDTLELRGLTLRLFGVDAPETGQTCGAAGGPDWDCGVAARSRLADLIAGRDLVCSAQDRDSYGRVVATCAAEGIDLGAALVAEGLAWSYRHFTTVYAAAEASARAERRGIWQGPATAAWDWRRTAGFSPAAGSAAPEGCAIKGNVNAKGARIYHTPASPWYRGIEIDPARGQRWFCDEAEALAAGWRPPRGLGLEKSVR